MTKAVSSALIYGIAAMALVVLASNILVQFPVKFAFGQFNLADILTWGAFTYPAAFLVTDLTNRKFGPAIARKIVIAGFLIAVVMSFVLATPRIAIASGTAFLVAQLLDVAIFDRLRRSSWWQAPFVSSLIGSLVDTFLFFTLAFSAAIAVLITVFGAADEFAIGSSALLGIFAVEFPRWVSWATGDLFVKLLVAVVLLAPYRYISFAIFPSLDADTAK